MVLITLATRSLVHGAGLLLPAYRAFKRFRTEHAATHTHHPLDAGSDLGPWWVATVQHFSVMAVFVSVEWYADWALFWWVPFYYELKLLAVLWLVLPHTRGSVALYRSVLAPFLVEHERDIDRNLELAHRAVRTRAAKYLVALFQSVRAAVMRALASVLGLNLGGANAAAAAPPAGDPAAVVATETTTAAAANYVAYGVISSLLGQATRSATAYMDTTVTTTTTTAFTSESRFEELPPDADTTPRHHPHNVAPDPSTPVAPPHRRRGTSDPGDFPASASPNANLMASTLIDPPRSPSPAVRDILAARRRITVSSPTPPAEDLAVAGGWSTSLASLVGLGGPKRTPSGSSVVEGNAPPQSPSPSGVDDTPRPPAHPPVAGNPRNRRPVPAPTPVKGAEVDELVTSSLSFEEYNLIDAAAAGAPAGSDGDGGRRGKKVKKS
ncbi:hypothetical protein H9P43_009483 [Blastocladiella emersonii ATCC 22665]|nr:hypothetical protein H9P43_009483 [Blastocladiella emersonii ATCC 22665]